MKRCERAGGKEVHIAKVLTEKGERKTTRHTDTLHARTVWRNICVYSIT